MSSAQDLTASLGLTLNAPAGELARRWETGAGLAITGEFASQQRWTFAGSVSVARYPGKALQRGGVSDKAGDLDAWGISAGARSYLGGGSVNYGGLYVASELGYFRFTERDESGRGNLTEETAIGVLPTIGYRAGSFDIAAQVNLGGPYQWLGFRGSLTLLKK